MATNLPAKLKVPAIQPFAIRAAQLENVDAVIAHWCRYYMVQTIITKGLHEADDECRDYTSQIMDTLEQTKNQNPSNELMQPNDAAQAYVEKFAMDTFARADNAIHGNQASRQTVETFQAASNFMELLGVFGPLDPEIASKIKYAKYHALRIVKAIRAGEDPNLSNPKDETVPAADPSLLAPAPYEPPTVESAPESMHPSRAPSTMQSVPLAAAPPSGVQTPNNGVVSIDPRGVSPIEDTATTNGKPAGYFVPPVPESPPTSIPEPAPLSDIKAPESFYAPSPHPEPNTQPHPLNDLRQPGPAPAPHSMAPPAQYHHQQQQHTPAPAPVPFVSSINSTRYHADDEAVASAQKHAKWAISALNFEDVNTAVKELRLALQVLGAS